MTRPGTVPPVPPVLAATALVGLSALHVAWGLGSPWPMRDRAELAAVAAGTDEMPSPAACFAVAGALATAAALTAGVGGRHPVARAGRLVAGGVLLARGATGVLGRTRWLVPWVPTDRFVRLDRRWHGPSCVVLGSLVLLAAPAQTAGP